MKLIIKQFSPSSCNLLSLTTKHSPQYPDSHTFNLYKTIYEFYYLVTSMLQPANVNGYTHTDTHMHTPTHKQWVLQYFCYLTFKWGPDAISWNTVLNSCASFEWKLVLSSSDSYAKDPKVLLSGRLTSSMLSLFCICAVIHGDKVSLLFSYIGDSTIVSKLGRPIRFFDLVNVRVSMLCRLSPGKLRTH